MNRKQTIAALDDIIKAVRAAGPFAFSPVDMGDEFAVSPILLRARAAMEVAEKLDASNPDPRGHIAPRATAALRGIVDGAIAKLDMTDDTLTGEAEDMRRARLAQKKARQNVRKCA